MKRCVRAVIGMGVLLAANRAFGLEPREVKVDGWNLVVAGQTIAIEKPSVQKWTFDAVMKEGTPGWAGPVHLPGPAWVFEALRPESLVATLADDPKTVLEKGKDFLVDDAWGSVAGVKGGRAPAGTKVHFVYEYGMSRLDLLVRGADGKLSLIKGKEDRTEPMLPEVPAGATAVLSVYLPNGAKPLSMDDVNLMDPKYDGVPTILRGEALKAVKEKIAAGKAVTIVFLGDSITAQQLKDQGDKQGSYIDRFAAWMQRAHPESSVVVCEYGKPVPAGKDKQICIVKAGVGGDDTVRAKRRLEKDVIARKPDAVVIMLGVNDENKTAMGNEVSVDAYKANLEEMVDAILKSGSEVALMTTSMKNVGWSGTGGNLAEYAKAMRAVAEEKKVCLIDNYAAWEKLPKRGYNYMVLLGNCINHPVDIGHEQMFLGVKAAFGSPEE